MKAEDHGAELRDAVETVAINVGLDDRVRRAYLRQLANDLITECHAAIVRADKAEAELARVTRERGMARTALRKYVCRVGNRSVCDEHETPGCNDCPIEVALADEPRGE